MSHHLLDDDQRRSWKIVCYCLFLSLKVFLKAFTDFFFWCQTKIIKKKNKKQKTWNYYISWWIWSDFVGVWHKRQHSINISHLLTCFSTNIIYCISCRLIVHKRQVLILDLLLPSYWWLANTENNKKCWESFISDCLFLSSIRNAFRNGLIQGDKLVIYPILQWLFENLPELKKRAYLARYLVKVEIPPDQLADQELYELHESVRLSVSCLLQLILFSSPLQILYPDTNL